jgi:hypothetical protein
MINGNRNEKNTRKKQKKKKNGKDKRKTMKVFVGQLAELVQQSRGI